MVVSKISLYNPSGLECIEPELTIEGTDPSENVDVNVPLEIIQSINRNLRNYLVHRKNLDNIYIQKDITGNIDNTQSSVLFHIYTNRLKEDMLSERGDLYFIGREINENLCVFIGDKYSRGQFLVELPTWSLGSYLPIKSSKLRKERELRIENKLFEDLISLSSKIKKTDKTEEKIDLVIKLDNLMKNNKELIKKKFHDFIVGILNSL